MTMCTFKSFLSKTLASFAVAACSVRAHMIPVRDTGDPLHQIKSFCLDNHDRVSNFVDKLSDIIRVEVKDFDVNTKSLKFVEGPRSKHHGREHPIDFQNLMGHGNPVFSTLLFGSDEAISVAELLHHGAQVEIHEEVWARVIIRSGNSNVGHTVELMRDDTIAALLYKIKRNTPIDLERHRLRLVSNLNNKNAKFQLNVGEKDADSLEKLESTAMSMGLTDECVLMYVARQKGGYQIFVQNPFRLEETSYIISPMESLRALMERIHESERDHNGNLVFSPSRQQLTMTNDEGDTQILPHFGTPELDNPQIDLSLQDLQILPDTTLSLSLRTLVRIFKMNQHVSGPAASPGTFVWVEEHHEENPATVQDVCTGYFAQKGEDLVGRQLLIAPQAGDDSGFSIRVVRDDVRTLASLGIEHGAQVRTTETQRGGVEHGAQVRMVESKNFLQ